MSSALERALRDRRLTDPERLLDLAGYQGPKRRNGRAWRIRCPSPAHEDRNPSCSLYVGRNLTLRWHCHACSAKGDALNLIAVVRFGGELGAAIRFVNGEAYRSTYSGAPRVKPKSRSEPTNDERRLRTSAIASRLLDLCELEGPVAEYVQARGLKDIGFAGGLRSLPQLAAELRVVSTLLEEWPHEALIDAYIINGEGCLALRSWPLLLFWRDPKTEQVTLQRRAINPAVEPKYRWCKGLAPTAPHRFGPDSNTVIVCEGFLDGLSLHVLEPSRTVFAFPSASSIRPEWQCYFENKTVFVAFDDDAAGTRASEVFAETYQVANAIRAIPEAGNDWNGLLKISQEGDL